MFVLDAYSVHITRSPGNVSVFDNFVCNIDAESTKSSKAQSRSLADRQLFYILSVQGNNFHVKIIKHSRLINKVLKK